LIEIWDILKLFLLAKISQKLVDNSQVLCYNNSIIIEKAYL
jgi:hypothetical protein